MSDLIGKTVDRYQIVEEVGRGGMGTVFRAYDTALNREVAIKVLSPNLSGDAECVARFQTEAQSAARLHHPNIVSIFHIGAQDGLHYLVMQYLPGKSLSEVLRTEGALSPDRVVRVVGQVASALDHAHRQGFVHRDIKPDNIIIGPGDHATLTDFGIVRALATARLTRTGRLIGTPAYMAPEQVRGAEVGPPADIYALGIVCYQMLTGILPFRGETPAVLHAQAYASAPPIRRVNPRLSAGVESAIKRALAKAPQRRWAQASGLAQALSRAVAKLPTAVRFEPGTSGAAFMRQPSTTIPAQQSKATWQVVGGAVTVAIVVLALLLLLSRGPKEEEGSISSQSTTETAVQATTTISSKLTPTTSVAASPSSLPPTVAYQTPSATLIPYPTPAATLSGASAPSYTPMPTEQPTPRPTAEPPCRKAQKGWIGFRRQQRCNIRTGDGCGTIEVWVMKPDGTNQAKMCNPTSYDWALVRDRTSNDGQWRLEVGGRRPDIIRVWADGKEEPIIVNNRKDWDPALSADNWWLAWVTNRNANDEIYIKTLDPKDQNQRRLTENDWEWDKHPTWSPDGHKIAFYSNRADSLAEATRQIWVLEVIDDRGANLRNLSNNPDKVDTDPVWFKWDNMPQ